MQAKPESVVPTKKPRISFVADDELKADLEEWAEEESRSISNLCEVLIRQAVQQRKSKQSSDQPSATDTKT